MAGRRSTVRATVAIYAVATVLGGLLGLASLYLAIGQVLATGTVQSGPWRTDPAIGSALAPPYLRAAISVAAVLALDSAEVLYFFAFTDSDGRGLRSGCSYTIEGREPDARWWSITAYRRNGYLPATSTGRYSVEATSVARRADGTFSAKVTGGSATAATAGDIVLAEDTAFNLMLRLYVPGREMSSAPAAAILPTIRRTGCR
jgi:hypothetical protein